MTKKPLVSLMRNVVLWETTTGVVMGSAKRQIRSSTRLKDALEVENALETLIINYAAIIKVNNLWVKMVYCFLESAVVNVLRIATAKTLSLLMCLCCVGVMEVVDLENAGLEWRIAPMTSSLARLMTLVQGAVMDNVLIRETLYSVNTLYPHSTSAIVRLIVMEYSPIQIVEKMDSALISQERKSK